MYIAQPQVEPLQSPNCLLLKAKRNIWPISLWGFSKCSDSHLGGGVCGATHSPFGVWALRLLLGQSVFANLVKIISLFEDINSNVQNRTLYFGSQFLFWYFHMTMDKFIFLFYYTMYNSAAYMFSSMYNELKGKTWPCNCHNYQCS